MYTQRGDGVAEVDAAHDVVERDVGGAPHRPAEAARLDEEDRHRLVEVLDRLGKGIGKGI